jgi:hypothetical protein
VSGLNADQGVLRATTNRSTGAVYSSSSIRVRPAIGLAVLALGTIAAPLLWGLYRAYYGLTRFGPVAAAAWSRPWLLAAVAFIPFWLLAAVWLVVLSRRKVVLHDQGLEFTGYGGLLFWKKRAVAWGDIRGVAVEMSHTHRQESAGIQCWRVKIHLRKNRIIKLQGRSGEDIKIGEIRELSELASHLKARVYPRLMPGLKQDFYSGKQIWFGPVLLTQNHLTLRKNGILLKVPLEKVRRVTVANGFLMVESDEHQKSKCYRFPIYAVPNLELLVQFLNQGSVYNLTRYPQAD